MPQPASGTNVTLPSSSMTSPALTMSWYGTAALITGNTTDMMNTNTNTASVGRRVRRSRPNNRSSAGTQPSSGSNLGAEAAEDPSAPGSGISAQPFYPVRRRPNGAPVRVASGEMPGINKGDIRGFGSRSTDHLLGSEFMTIDRMALAAGSIRLASGISFLVDPLRANRLWGDPDKPTPTAQLLLRSMGYRDALIGGLLATAALGGKYTRGGVLEPVAPA